MALRRVDAGFEGQQEDVLDIYIALTKAEACVECVWCLLLTIPAIGDSMAARGVSTDDGKELMALLVGP